MKGFIAALITLSVLIGCITWNGIWVHSTLAELMGTVSKLDKAAEAERAETSADLFDKWKSCRRILAITVSHTEIESIDTRIASLVTYAKNGESSDFEATLAGLTEELEFLHRSESLTVEGII